MRRRIQNHPLEALEKRLLLASDLEFFYQINTNPRFRASPDLIAANSWNAVFFLEQSEFRSDYELWKGDGETVSKLEGSISEGVEFVAEVVDHVIAVTDDNDILSINTVTGRPTLDR